MHTNICTPKYIHCFLNGQYVLLLSSHSQRLKVFNNLVQASSYRTVAALEYIMITIMISGRIQLLLSSHSQTLKVFYNLIAALLEYDKQN